MGKKGPGTVGKRVEKLLKCGVEEHLQENQVVDFWKREQKRGNTQ